MHASPPGPPFPCPPPLPTSCLRGYGAFPQPTHTHTAAPSRRSARRVWPAGCRRLWPGPPLPNEGAAGQGACRRVWGGQAAGGGAPPGSPKQQAPRRQPLARMFCLHPGSRPQLATCSTAAPAPTQCPWMAATAGTGQRSKTDIASCSKNTNCLRAVLVFFLGVCDGGGIQGGWVGKGWGGGDQGCASWRCAAQPCVSVNACRDAAARLAQGDGVQPART